MEWKSGREWETKVPNRVYEEVCSCKVYIHYTHILLPQLWTLSPLIEWTRTYIWYFYIYKDTYLNTFKNAHTFTHTLLYFSIITIFTMNIIMILISIIILSLFFSSISSQGEVETIQQKSNLMEQEFRVLVKTSTTLPVPLIFLSHETSMEK